MSGAFPRIGHGYQWSSEEVGLGQKSTDIPIIQILQNWGVSHWIEPMRVLSTKTILCQPKPKTLGKFQLQNDWWPFDPVLLNYIYPSVKLLTHGKELLSLKTGSWIQNTNKKIDSTTFQCQKISSQNLKVCSITLLHVATTTNHLYILIIAQVDVLLFTSLHTGLDCTTQVLILCCSTNRFLNSTANGVNGQIWWTYRGGSIIYNIMQHLTYTLSRRVQHIGAQGAHAWHTVTVVSQDWLQFIQCDQSYQHGQSSMG